MHELPDLTVYLEALPPALPGLRNPPVQRIRYAQNETNYCARCQTEGRLLADRALSRLLKADWPRFVDGFEQD